MSRVLQGLTSGIGFLCAGGAILTPDNGTHTRGFVTAANIWIAAVIVLAAGMGHATTTVIAAGFALIVLRVLQISKKQGRPVRTAQTACDELYELVMNRQRDSKL